MKLLVNEPAAMLGSRGIRRYYQSVMHHLRWEGDVEIIRHGKSRATERLVELLRTGRRDAIFWTPCQRGPLFARHHVVTVHDCISVEHVYPGDWRLGPYLRLFTQVLNNAKAIVAISNATKSAILRNYEIDGEKITIIPSGCDFLMNTRAEAAADKDADGPKGTAPYVLMVTNELPHKNTVLACQALAHSRAMREGATLEVVGSLAPAAEHWCQTSGIPLKVHTHVSDAQLRALYEGCLFLYSPSLDEGHNLPIAEAIQCNANVLCSDIPAHREYYLGRVRWFDPRSLEAMVNALDDALTHRSQWYDDSQVALSRSFAHVARDYEALFHAIRRES